MIPRDVVLIGVPTNSSGTADGADAIIGYLAQAIAGAGPQPPPG